MSEESVQAVAAMQQYHRGEPKSLAETSCMYSKITPLERRHLGQVLTWMSDQGLRDLVGTVLPTSRIKHFRWYKTMALDSTKLVFAIEDIASGRPLGLIGLSGIDLYSRSAELWMYLGDEAERGKGTGKEAFQSVVGYGFETLGLHRIFVQVFSFNTRAYAFFSKRGMRPEGTLREAVFKRGRFHDKHILGMLSNEYRRVIGFDGGPREKIETKR
jgi:RimJ/RimL family protein N-acetyltransferase